MFLHLKTVKVDTPREADILHRTFMFCGKMQYRLCKLQTFKRCMCR